MIEGNKVKLSSLLNTFNRIVSSEVRKTIITTNYIKRWIQSVIEKSDTNNGRTLIFRLDSALVHSGLVDYK